MSLVKINDGLDITITNDDEFQWAMTLLMDYMNSKSNHHLEETPNEDEITFSILEDALKLYKGNYYTIE